MSDEILGVIGGTGLSELDGFKGEHKLVRTPYGSVDMLVGEYLERVLMFVARHGLHGDSEKMFEHVVQPHLVNYRATIAAFRLAEYKGERCGGILAFSSVGSLDEDIVLGESVSIPSGWNLNPNMNRVDTFFDEPGAVVHYGREPFCPQMQAAIKKAAEEAGYAVDEGNISHQIQGPRFLSLDESEDLQVQNYIRAQLGLPLMTTIGMTLFPEAQLAAEAELDYASVLLPTDKNKVRDKEHVSVDVVIANARKNEEVARHMLTGVAQAYEHKPEGCDCRRGLDDAVQSYHPEIVKSQFLKETLLARF